MSKNQLSAADQIARIRKKLKHFTLDKPVDSWLDTGSKRLNAVLGSEELGIPYGRMLEIYGPNSHGKTMIALFLAAVAQANGAKVAWVDLERSFDERWVTSQGVKFNEVFLFQTEILKKGEDVELQSAEELFEEVEYWMKEEHRANPDQKLLIVVDSVAAILTGEEADAGLSGQNMRTNMALPSFLSKMLRKWVALSANCNAMVILINQIRAALGTYGAPEYAPGGNASKHYCSIRATVRRVKGGRLTHMGKVVGLRGVIKNVKNKAGGGSLEGGECGYETLFGKRKWKFPTVAEVRKDGKEGEE